MEGVLTTYGTLRIFAGSLCRTLSNNNTVTESPSGDEADHAKVVVCPGIAFGSSRELTSNLLGAKLGRGLKMKHKHPSQPH
jgi:hypothetical protein